MKQCDKVRYSKKEYAEADIKKIKHNSLRDKVPIRAYLCYRCDAWHLTSQESKEMRHITNLETSNDGLKSKVEKLEKENKKLKIKITELQDRIVLLNRSNKQIQEQWIQTKQQQQSPQSA